MLSHHFQPSIRVALSLPSTVKIWLRCNHQESNLSVALQITTNEEVALNAFVDCCLGCRLFMFLVFVFFFCHRPFFFSSVRLHHSADDAGLGSLQERLIPNVSHCFQLKG